MGGRALGRGGVLVIPTKPTALHQQIVSALNNRTPGRTPGNPGPGRVAFSSASASLTCRLGAESAKRSGGVGGWSTIDLPGREAGSEWVGLPAVTMTIPLLFDGLAERRSVESQIAALYALGRPVAGSPRGTTPPILRLAGMVPHGGREWVMDSIDEGEAVWDGASRIRLWATVSLTAFEALDVITITARKKGKAPATRVYVVRRGDTLGSIARDEMDAKTAKAIAAGVATLKRLNGIRDPKSIRPGQRLKIPRDGHDEPVRGTVGPGR